jgi:hypothetical protein
LPTAVSGRVYAESGLDYKRVDVVSTADDKVLRAPAQPDIPVLIDRAEIAGIGLCTRIKEQLCASGSIKIARRNAGSADRKNAIPGF